MTETVIMMVTDTHHILLTHHILRTHHILHILLTLHTHMMEMIIMETATITMVAETMMTDGLHTHQIMVEMVTITDIFQAAQVVEMMVQDVADQDQEEMVTIDLHIQEIQDQVAEIQCQDQDQEDS